MTVLRERSWQAQPQSYGREFAGVYDLVFPLDRGARDTARALSQLAHTVPPDPTGGPPTGPALPVLAEFGVGTARIAVPLAATGHPVHGADTSAELLALARARADDLGPDTSGRLHLELADVRDWRPRARVALAYCVCATVSMLQTRPDQATALRRMHDAVVPGGLVVLETHSPGRVHRLHATQDVVEHRIPVDGLPGGLTSVSTLAPDRRSWQLDHTWTDPDDGRERRSTEWSLLTGPRQLAALAVDAGLTPVSEHSDWAGAPLDDLSPTFVSVFRRPPSTPGAPAATGTDTGRSTDPGPSTDPTQEAPR